MSHYLHKYKEFQYVLIVLKLHPLEVGSELVHPRTCSYGLVNKVNKCFYEQISHTWSTDPTVISSFTAITVSSSSRLCGGVTTCMMRGSVGKCSTVCVSWRVAALNNKTALCLNCNLRIREQFNRAAENRGFLHSFNCAQGTYQMVQCHS